MLDCANAVADALVSTAGGTVGSQVLFAARWAAAVPQ